MNDNELKNYNPNKNDTFYIQESDVDKGCLFPDKLTLVLSVSEHPELIPFIKNNHNEIAERLNSECSISLEKTSVWIVFNTRTLKDNSKPFAVAIKPIVTEHTDKGNVSTVFTKYFRNLEVNESNMVLYKIKNALKERGFNCLKEGIEKNDLPKTIKDWKRMKFSLGEAATIAEKLIKNEEELRKNAAVEAKAMEMKAEEIKIPDTLTICISPRLGRISGNSYSFSVPMGEEGQKGVIYIPKKDVTLDKNNNFYTFDINTKKEYVIYPKSNNKKMTGLEIALAYDKAEKKYLEDAKKKWEEAGHKSAYTPKFTPVTGLPDVTESKKQPKKQANEDIKNTEKREKEIRKNIPPLVEKTGTSYVNINIDGVKGVKTVPNDVDKIVAFCASHMKDTIEVSTETGKALILYEAGMVTNKGATVSFMDEFMSKLSTYIMKEKPIPLEEPEEEREDI